MQDSDSDRTIATECSMDPEIPQVVEKRKIDSNDDMEMPSKRQKGNDVDSPDQNMAMPETPVRHEKFWASDGNVILQLDNVLFKVHKSRMINESECFSVLFSDQGDPEMDGILVGHDDDEGCDVYVLDSTKVQLRDFEALLRAMDDAISYYLNPPLFDAVASILRASYILKFTKMNQFAVGYLERMFSSSLPLSMPGPMFSVFDATSAILLGRTLCVPGVLKRAFYELACAAPSGFRFGLDGLNTSDLVDLLTTQKTLVSYWLQLPATLAEKFQPCSSCSGRLGSGIPEAYRCSERHARDPIRGIQYLLEKDWEEFGYCRKCALEKGQALVTIRDEIWSFVDGWFDV